MSATNIAFIRTQKECKEIVTSAELQQNGISIEIMNDSLSVLTGYIRGPPDSPYESASFVLDIRVPNDYPFKPPKVKFVTKCWHPNVSSQTGAICLDILADQWSASMTIRTVLLSIQSLLAYPVPNDPQDAVVAKQCLTNPSMYNATAKFWAQHYAKCPGEIDPEMMRKCSKLREMGVTMDEAISALSCNEWNLSKATENVFS